MHFNTVMMRQNDRTGSFPRFLVLGLLSLPLISVGGCGSAGEEEIDFGRQSGGSTGIGGALATGGSNPGVGGVVGTGAAQATGAASAIGGAGSGGLPGTGAEAGTGGIVGTGAVAGTGGIADPGGTSGTGADGSTGGTTGGTGGASVGGTSGTGGASVGGTSAGGTSGAGGASTGGTSNSGGTNGVGGTTSECTNVSPPFDPNWPEATCDKWANETPECGAEWFADYCDMSCGRCTSGTGGTSSGGAGGTSSGGVGGTSSGGAGGTNTGGTNNSGGTTGAGGSTSDCTNVSPPYDPSWPDATCDKWANETPECGAAWFADYCDMSCGRCTSSGTGGTSSTGGTSGSGGTSSGGSGGTSSGGTSSGGTGGGTTLPDINGGQNGWASRYWDCCKAHCAWPANGGTEATCSANGTAELSSDTQSACSGGSGYVCNSDVPRAVSSTVSYGRVAVPNAQCGVCYHIQFTGTSHNAPNDAGSAAIAGKHMIVRASNTGGDVASGQFDLMIPGGGVGVNQNTCPQQWGASTGDMGAQYGGFLSTCSGDHAARKACVKNKCNTVVPAGQLRDSCNWFVDWFQVADNPNFKVEPIACPSDI